MQVPLCPPHRKGSTRIAWLLTLLVELAFASPATAQGSGAAVLRTDQEMAAAVAARDVSSFQKLLHPDAIFLGAGRLEKGPQAVLRAWDAFFDPQQGKTLLWQPQEARVAQSADLAFTTGTFQLQHGLKGQQETVAEGRYITVWRHTEKGWRVAADGTATALDPPDLELKLEMTQKPPRAILQGAAAMAARAVRVFPSEAGDLAFAVGDYAAPGLRGSHQALRGVFLAVWEKSTEGHWRLVAGSFPPPQ